MFRVQDRKYISLPGDMFQGHLSPTSDQNYSTVNIPPLNIFWFIEDYFHKDVSLMSPCFMSTQQTKIKCLHSYYSSKYVIIFESNGVKKSWTEASKLCRRTHGFLPVFKNREDLNMLITFLKSSYGFPPIEGLYIGLKIYPNQVSLNNTIIFWVRVLPLNLFFLTFA